MGGRETEVACEEPDVILVLTDSVRCDLEGQEHLRGSRKAAEAWHVEHRGCQGVVSHEETLYPVVEPTGRKAEFRANLGCAGRPWDEAGSPALASAEHPFGEARTRRAAHARLEGKPPRR